MSDCLMNQDESFNVSTPAFLETSPTLDRKRKHVDTIESSPAPSDAQNPTTETVLLPGNVQATASRPRLTVSRGPVFIPTSENSNYWLTDHIAMNRLGFRYIPAGIAEEGSKIPYRTIESRPEGYVRVSWEDRSPFIKVTQDGLGLMGENGFRSARCNVPIREGKWYMEVKIEHGGGDSLSDSSRREGAHVRLGWARREAPLNGPVGQDGYSYGYRDKTGDRVTLSRPRPYGRTFGSGDVIGLYLSLPPRKKPRNNDPHDPARIRRERIAIDFKGQEYWESLEYPQTKEMEMLMHDGNKAKASASLPSTSKKSATVKNIPERGRNPTTFPEPVPLRPLPTLHGSRVSFFVNGECQGVAFQDIYDYLQLRSEPSSRKAQPKRKLREGTREHKENPFDDGSLGYYPFISLFNRARVRVNPGPNFDFPPPPDIDALLSGHEGPPDSMKRTWRPICERYTEYMAEQWALDAKEEQEAKAAATQQQTTTDDAEAKAAAKREKRRLADQKRRAERKAMETLARQTKQRDSSLASQRVDSPNPPAVQNHSPSRPQPPNNLNEPVGGEPDSGWNSLDEMELLARSEHGETVPEDNDYDMEILAALD